MNRLQRESEEERPEPIPLCQYQSGIRLLLPVPHGGSGMKIGGANFSQKKKVVARSFTADRNLLQPTGGCEQNTLTRHIFSCFTALITVSHVKLAQGAVRVIPSMCHSLVCLIPLRLSRSDVG